MFIVGFLYRKDKLSPGVPSSGKVFLPKSIYCHRRKAPFFAPPETDLQASASLTVEAAIAFPVFLFVMLTVMQLFAVYDHAQKCSAALAQTAREMAVGAYLLEHEEADTLPETVLSAAYAAARTSFLAGKSDAARNENYLLSSFRAEDELIDLVLTYQMKSPTGMIRLPFTVFLQRACVRAWTGREGSSGEQKEEEDPHTIVYVAENGRVYHKDRNCTHLKLAISSVGLEAAKTMKNVYLQRYKPCEICGKKAGSKVYITTDGNRYHSSLDCPGLKRTVREAYLDEISLPPCSRCGG